MAVKCTAKDCVICRMMGTEDTRSHMILEKAFADAEASMALAIRSEKNAQKTHKDFGKETNAIIEAKREDIVNKSVTSTAALTQFALFGSRDGELSVDEFDEMAAGVAEAIAAEVTANEIFEKVCEQKRPASKASLCENHLAARADEHSW